VNKTLSKPRKLSPSCAKCLKSADCEEWCRILLSNNSSLFIEVLAKIFKLRKSHLLQIFEKLKMSSIRY
jgi:hypothetical protein